MDSTAFDCITALQQEEALLTELITKYERTKSNWVPDVVGRAYGNRGNARSRQGKLVQSLEDYNTAIRICPWSGDPVLNRFVPIDCTPCMSSTHGEQTPIVQSQSHHCQLCIHNMMTVFLRSGHRACNTRRGMLLTFGYKTGKLVKF